MGMQSDITRENVVQFLCEKLAEKIKIEDHQQNLETAKALKDFGIVMLQMLPNIPAWAISYFKLFRS